MVKMHWQTQLGSLQRSSRPASWSDYWEGRGGDGKGGEGGDKRRAERRGEVRKR